MRLLLTPLITVMLLVGGSSTAAQDTAPTKTTREDTKPPVIDTRANSQNESSDPGRREATQNSPSPFDYQSSEEISEDLSVSFPVDI